MKTDRPAFFQEGMPAPAHLPLFLMAVLPLLVAHAIGLVHLPPVPCLFAEFSGVSCPFCGYTRAFQAMADGDFLFAFTTCPLAYVLYIVCMFMALWNGAALISGSRVKAGKRFWMGFEKHAGLVIAGLVLMNWGYRLALGLK